MKRSELEALLPEVFQRTLLPGSLLGGILDVMEALHDPDEQILAAIEAYFDPNRAPERFVPYLARWVDLERVMGAVPAADPGAAWPAGLAQLRALIGAAAELSRWSGTLRGLVRFLELATGVGGFTVDEQVPGPDQRPRPFHIAVHVPAGAERYSTLIARIVEAEKPAYVTYDLIFPAMPEGGSQSA